MNYVGIDHHRQYSHTTLMDQEGQGLRSGRAPNLRFEIERFLEGGEAIEVVIETGRSSYTIVDFLEDRKERSVGFPVLLSLPAASRPPFRYLKFNLTSLHIMFYHP